MVGQCRCKPKIAYLDEEQYEKKCERELYCKTSPLPQSKLNYPITRYRQGFVTESRSRINSENTVLTYNTNNPAPGSTAKCQRSSGTLIKHCRQF